ncbi:Holliday junction DNA helicase RuvA [Fimbriiglobus ruber]|uniref:Holliday junction branch migration complex subunit RuvA n=2 Tax=Fimbriiglobus ruber TaxID=1908690 RepID=A0A225CZ38_9BACT|nr:Holliday junction DNA helicase RuvA [Fimbriiglobus ruber]
MITKMTGVLNRVLDDEVRLQVGPFEYQVMVPEMVRRQLQLKTGQEVTFHTTEYLEGNQSSSRFIPRRVGFNTEAELEFFDLFCTVEKIGVKKALKALSRPVKEIADAISRQDSKWLTTLPGIGAATAEQIVTTLKRKVTKFAVMGGQVVEGGADGASGSPKGGTAASTADGQLIEDIYQVLMSLGHPPLEARTKLDQLLTSGKAFKSVEEAITLVYSRG